jgi:hypothetical protein
MSRYFPFCICFHDGDWIFKAARLHRCSSSDIFLSSAGGSSHACSKIMISRPFTSINPLSDIWDNICDDIFGVVPKMIDNCTFATLQKKAISIHFPANQNQPI